MGCLTVEVVCVVTEIVINKVEKNYLKKKKNSSKRSRRAGLEPLSTTLFLSCCCLHHFCCVSMRRGEVVSLWWSFQLSKVEDGGGVT